MQFVEFFTLMFYQQNTHKHKRSSPHIRSSNFPHYNVEYFNEYYMWIMMTIQFSSNERPEC